MLEDANQMIVRREAHRRRFDKYIEEAKAAAQQASLVVDRAHQALARSVALAAAGNTAAPSLSTRPQSAASQRPRPGNDAFFKGSIAYMTSSLHRGES